MYRQTLTINHGQHELENGHGHHHFNGHNGISEHRSETNSYFSESDCQIGSYSKFHVVEKTYSVERGGNGKRCESVCSEGSQKDEVSCFVRSEIKWVFLKNMKVILHTRFMIASRKKVMDCLTGV